MPRHLALLAALLVVGLTLTTCDSPPPQDTDEDPAPTAAQAPATSTPAPATEPDPPPPEPDPPPEPPPPPEPVVQPAAPVRGAWVHLFDDSLKSRASIAQVVQELVAADATAIFAQVARRHDAYYTSDVLPRTPDPGLEPGLDVLAELIEQARPAGLEVHAWVGVAPTWHADYDALPRPAGWLPAEHGERAPEAQRWVTRTVDGQWTDYLDPGVPEVRAHVTAVVAELAQRYPVDGIHLDYVRYNSAAHGYHPAALARYQAETGAAGTPAPTDPAWSAWRREQTRGLVVGARDAIAATGRDIDLSAAVITWEHGPTAGRPFEATRTYTETLQDWPGWAREGLLDAVLPMNYFRGDRPDQARWFGEWLAFESQLAASTDTLVVPGIAGFLNPPATAVAQIEAATQSTDGAMMYSYQQPTVDHSRGVWATLAERVWGLPGQ